MTFVFIQNLVCCLLICLELYFHLYLHSNDTLASRLLFFILYCCVLLVILGQKCIYKLFFYTFTRLLQLNGYFKTVRDTFVNGFLRYWTNKNLTNHLQKMLKQSNKSTDHFLNTHCAEYPLALTSISRVSHNICVSAGMLLSGCIVYAELACFRYVLVSVFRGGRYSTCVVWKAKEELCKFLLKSHMQHDDSARLSCLFLNA